MSLGDAYRFHCPAARRLRVAAGCLAPAAPTGVSVCQETVAEDDIEMPQVHSASRCSRCKYGLVRRGGSLCMGCKEFLAWEAAEQRRQEQAERRREKLQQMHPRVRPLYVIGEAVGYAVLIAATLILMVVAYSADVWRP
jgi:hypothetical protein